MDKKLSVLVATILLLASSLVRALPQQITDAAEYNAYVAALGETDKAKKIQLIDAFLAKYPNTVVKEQALEVKLQTQQQSGQMGADTAKEILKVNPNNSTAMLVLSFAFM